MITDPPKYPEAGDATEQWRWSLRALEWSDAAHAELAASELAATEAAEQMDGEPLSPVPAWTFDTVRALVARVRVLAQYVLDTTVQASVGDLARRQVGDLADIWLLDDCGCPAEVTEAAREMLRACATPEGLERYLRRGAVLRAGGGS